MTPPDPLDDLDPFDLFDGEAARLDRFFAGLSGTAWTRPSRCSGWMVRDVLGHLAGEELYNHACLDDELGQLFARLSQAGVNGLAGFNEWCARQRRELPVEEVLAEWRERNEQTRERMRELGRNGTLSTQAGPYPVGLQTLHYASEYATHADDVGAPGFYDRVHWRVRLGLFALAEQGSKAQVETSDGKVRVDVGGQQAELSDADFVEATVDRLPNNHPLDPTVRRALICLA